MNTKYLAPLFVAYDDQLNERDHIITDHETQIEGLCDQVEGVIRENQHLHARLDQSGGVAHVSMHEWSVDLFVFFAIIDR